MGKDTLCFSKTAKFLFDEGQVVAVNRFSGKWMRFSRECYEYLLKGIDAGLSADGFLECFMDENDKAYIQKLIDGLQRIGVVTDVAQREREEEPYLESVQFSLTNRCNLQCKHCIASATGMAGEDPLSTDDIKAIIDKLVSCRVKTIILSGGEPLVRKDFLEILRYIKKADKKIEISLMTNALLITESNVREIVDCVEDVDISLDGYDEETCRRIRGKNVYGRVLKSIELLQKNGMSKIALSMVSLGNDVESDRKFNELCKRLNVTPMIRRLSYMGRAKENEGYLRSLEKNTQLTEMAEIPAEKARSATKACSCKAGIRVINIDECGDIYPCNTFTACMKKIGNVIEIDSLYDFLKGRMNSTDDNEMSFFKFNPYYEEICKECNLRYFCWTCPYATMDYLNENADYSRYCEGMKAFLTPIIWGEKYERV
ncbi:radical SAM additional 4Fe4S-binding SPASM domain-containing protein [Lachnospiraceae bacterium YSD2013]|nr:radical SAM additional 4Fe4S-binding SPASM domain-containing protein [Lachnospiraceae bacterium YSD2013]